MGLLSQQFGKVVELPAGSTLCSPVFRGSSGCLDVGGQASRAVFKKNASYDTIELMGYGQELMIGSQGQTLHINYRATTTCTPANWHWRCGNSSSYSHHYFGNVCSCSCLRGPKLLGTTCVCSPIVCGGTCVYSNCLYVNNAQVDECLTITGSKILKTGGYNKPGLQMTGTGTYDFCDLNVFLKNTTAANSAIFSDYEPHGEWGLFHDNNADAFYITAGSSCHNVGSFNMKNCAGTVRTAYIKQKFVQGDGTAEIGGSLSVSPDCSNNYNGVAIGCTYTNIGGWNTQLSMYGTQHVVARWNHSGGSNSANNAQTNCIFAHINNPFVMLSSGNIRLCGQDTVCITGKGVACTCFQTPILCAPTCVCSPIVCASSCVHTGDLCLTEDYSGDMSNGIQLGRANGIPQAAWGESGSKTGRIEIGLPTKDGEGGSTHLGMVHVAVDVYEYDGNNAMSFIIGGHNWNCRWYNCGAHISAGCTNKTIKLAYHACGGTCDGRYVILLGECDSTWNYGSVHVRRVNNGLYYLAHMDMGTPMYIKRVTCPDSYYNCPTGDLRSSSKDMAAYQCAMVCVHTPRVCATTCVRSACLHSTGNICGHEICAGSWFRNATSGAGLYNSANGFHFYATAANNIRIYGASANNIGLQGYSCGAARGCLHFNCSNQIHLYDMNGNPRFLINAATDIRLCNPTCLHCNIYVGGRIFACNQSESINFKGARGCFTNEYMHLYNKVGIGHPSGWGCGEGNTPDKGLSTYGKACIGYGVTASTTHLKVAGGVSTLGARALYSESYGNLFYPDAAGTWNLQSASGQTHSSLRFRRGDSTIDGYVYSSTGGYIGFLDSSSHWAYGHQTDYCHWWNIDNTTRMKLVPNILDLTSSGASFQLRMFTCNNSTTRGSFYANCDNNVGILDKDSNWAIRHLSSGCTEFRIGNSTQAYMRSNCFCHGHTICANHCLRGDKVEGVTCVTSPVVCGTSCVQSCRYQHHWRSIAPGGDYDKFYPISFTMKGGQHSEDILEIAQSNVHSPGSSCGAMYLKVGLNITGWGHISNHYVVHKYATAGTNTLVSKIRTIDHSTCRVGVWLRGGVTYYYRSREGTIACNITNGTTNCCLSYDNSNNAYDVYVQSTSNVEDCNFGNQGGCNAGNAYLNHHSSLGTSVVLTTGNLQQALCCGCYTNTVCLGNCGVIKNTNFTTGTVCGNDLVRGGHVCGANCVTTQMLCSHKCLFVDQGNVYIDGGQCNGAGDATLYVTAYNNNDWAVIVNKNVDSASEYGLDLRMGATSTAAMYARFNNAVKFKLQYNCLCHDTMICSPAIKSSSYMNSGKFCAGSAYLCNGCLYVNGRTEGCCHISGSSYFCNNCLHVAGGNICSGNAVYLSEWVRFNCACRGLYWAGACQYHIYPSGCTYHMNFRTCADQAGILMSTNNNTTARGYFYANCNNDIGILDSDGNWAIRHRRDTGTYWSINNTDEMCLTTSCLCHSNVICAASVIKSGDWVCGNRVCGTHYGDGSNLTGISSGGGLCNSCVGDGNLCGFVVIGKCAAGNNCFGGLYSYDNTIAIGQNAMQNYSNTSSNFGDQVAVGQSAMAGSSNTGNCRNAAFGNGAGKYIAASKCYNTAVGTEALGGTSSYRAGSHNTAVGGGSGYFQCGDAGTFIGHCAGGQGAGAKSCGTFVGRCAGYGSTGVNGTFIGHKAGVNCSTANMTFIGSCSTCVACIYGNVCVSTLSKGSGSFVIAHPDPAKTDDWELKHSFVESPNEGDNIYRWQANVTNCCHVIELPSYYKFLNKNDMAWVSPDRHFGVGYAEVTADQECLVVCTNNDGNYNILLIGTRKDEIAVNNWKAAEIRKI